MLLSKYVICNSKKTRFIKDLKNLQIADGLLSILGIRTPLGKNHLLGNILF